MRPVHPPAGSAPRTRHSLVYLGIMGPQDNVETILDLMHELVHVRGRDDVDATLLGFGDCLEGLRSRSTELGLDDVVTFTGRADPTMIAQHLSAAAIGLCPDHKTPLNDLSTMNKTMEYMAYALPSVAFDLVETRVSGDDACLYVPSGDLQALADAVERLLDDPELRVSMARRARHRVASLLDWRPQAAAYVSVFDRLAPPVGVLDRPARRPERLVAPPAQDDSARLVDLEDEQAFRAFVLGRGPVRERAPGS